MAQTRTLAFEIGVEEIPAFDLVDAVKQLERKVPALLDDARIPHGAIEVYDSPRRLIVMVYDVAVETVAETEVFKGPAVRIAFDEAGAPTKAAEGFARGKGLTVDDLYREEQGLNFAARGARFHHPLHLLAEVAALGRSA